MSTRFQLATGFVVAAALLSAEFAFGQFGGGGGGGGRDRRREGYDPAEMLKRMDGNKNGMIEPSEIPGQSRMFIDRAAEKAGLDKSKAMPTEVSPWPWRQPSSRRRSSWQPSSWLPSSSPGSRPQPKPRPRSWPS